MIALYRYVAAGVLHRQLYLPPVLLFAVVVAVGSRGDGGPLLPLYALWVGAMLPCSVWLTVAVLATEDAVQERITRVNARRMWFPLVAGALVALTFDVVMAGAAVFFPLLVGVRPAGPADLMVGFLAQMAAAGTGVVVGLFCARQVILRPGYALLLAAVAVLALLLVRWIPPVNPLIRLLAGGDPASAVIGPVLLADASVAALLIAALPIARRLQRISG